jgi:hypothetical protein
MKTKIFYSILIVALLWVFSIIWKFNSKKTNDPIDEFKKAIIEADSLTKEKNGQYSKLDNYYKESSDLNKELKNSNRELYDLVKKQNERILNLTSTVITLQGKVDEGFGKIDPADSNNIELNLRYPSSEKPFVLWDGKLNTKTAKYNGIWTFGKLPIQILVTEESRGLWKHRISGPDWFIVDSLSVISLPPDQYPENVESNLQFLLGTNYSFSLVNQNQKNIGLGIGISAYSSHNILLNANTNKEIGLSYYYKFKSIKRRK